MEQPSYGITLAKKLHTPYNVCGHENYPTNYVSKIQQIFRTAQMFYMFHTVNVSYIIHQQLTVMVTVIILLPHVQTVEIVEPSS